MSLVLPALVGFLLIAWALHLLRQKPHLGEGFYLAYPQVTVTIGKATFRAAAARTIGSRTKGLSERESMLPEQAMLFTFPIAIRYAFQMKDMKFPLDIVWIRGEEVVEVSENLAPGLPKIRPKIGVDQVLEINAGIAARMGIKVGDKVQVVWSR